MQMLDSGNELTANGNREWTRMRAANGREMIRKKLKPNRRWTQIYADNIGFGYTSCKKDVVDFVEVYFCADQIRRGNPEVQRRTIGKSF